jgi:hypothetical protein
VGFSLNSSTRVHIDAISAFYSETRTRTSMGCVPAARDECRKPCALQRETSNISGVEPAASGHQDRKEHRGFHNTGSDQ